MEEFQQINKQGTRSSLGYVTQRIDRYVYEYREGDHVMQIFVEPLRRPGGEYYEELSDKSFSKWMPPYESENISSTHLEIIKKRVCAAIASMGIECRLESEGLKKRNPTETWPPSRPPQAWSRMLNPAFWGRASKEEMNQNQINPEKGNAEGGNAEGVNPSIVN